MGRKSGTVVKDIPCEEKFARIYLLHFWASLHQLQLCGLFLENGESKRLPKVRAVVSEDLSQISMESGKATCCHICVIIKSSMNKDHITL